MALVLLLGGAAPAAAGTDSLHAGPGPRPGPDILYAPPATAPQLTNDGVWQAAPILVSGATAYRRGEFLYQDWLYDDHGAAGGRRDVGDPRSSEDAFSAPNGTYTYPKDERYAHNAADLVELRIRPLPDATAFRLTYNTMLDPQLVATTVALGDAVPAASFPHGANVTAPASLFLTVHGTSAELERAGTLLDVLPAPTVSVDRERRQVEVRVPKAAFDPGRSRVRVAAGTGLWDPAAGRYRTPRQAATAEEPGGSGTLARPPAFFNVAFRSEAANPDAAADGEEPVPQIEQHGGLQAFSDPRWWRDSAQGRALAAGTIEPFFAMVDFGRLADGVEDDTDVPRTGVLNRILASHFEPAQGVDFRRSCGRPMNCEGQLLGRLQPYALYVPDRRMPPSGWSLTLLLHSLGSNYNQFAGSRNQAQFGERGRGSLVITPAGRGVDGWYYGLAGADTFEVWADVAARYDLDPAYTTIAGYSMGGYGTYKLGAQFPDLFARGQPTVGPPTLGVSPDARRSSTSPATSTYFMLPSLRHVPYLMWVASSDELVPVTGTVAQADRFDDLGYRYGFDVFSPAEHFTLAVNDQYAPAAAFLGDATVERDPPRVTYVVNPTMDFPEVGTVADHAYWLSGLEVRDRSGEQPRGFIDVRSKGFGAGDAPALPTRSGAGRLDDTRVTPLTFASRRKEWGAPRQVPAANALSVTAANVSRVTIDPRRARVRCDAQLDVQTDGPLTVELAGCGRPPQRFGAASASCRAAVGFVRAAALPAGQRVRIQAALLSAGRFDVDVFRQSRGRRVLGNRRVARFRGRTRSLTWRARGRRVGDGIYLVRLRTPLARGRVDVRRVVLERRGGRFRARPDFYRRRSCGTLSSFKLRRPVFGGRGRRPLGIAFRVNRRSVVRVDVLRGRRVVRRLAAGTRRTGVTHRLRLRAGGLRRGDHRVRIRVRPVGGAPVVATLVARRL